MASQLVMPRLDAEHWHSAEYRDSIFRLIDRGVGGFGVFCGTLEQTAIMLQTLQQRAGNTLLFGADYEYGLPMRLQEGGIAMPRAMALGKGSPEQTQQIAAAVAREMRAIGVHWNWAPVADINSEPDNPIINVRAFGETPELVAQHVAAWVKGSQEEHIAACVKHAPGHGATTVDSHQDLPTITVSAQRAARREFAPFRAGIETGVASVMMGHLLVPFLDRNEPASLSSAVVNGLVRDTWGYNGVVITDALDMGAVTKRYDSAKAAVYAIKAGNDLALMPANPNMAIDALQAAIDKGVISQPRLHASIDRIQVLRSMVKKWPRQTIINQSAHADLALTAAKHAVAFSGSKDLLPLLPNQQIAVFGIVGENDIDRATQWFQFLAQATEMNIDFGYVNGSITQDELDSLAQDVTGADVFVFGMFSAAGAYRSTLPEVHHLPRVMTTLANGKPIILVICGNPVVAAGLPNNLAINAYSDTTPSLAATVLTLTAKQ